MNIQETETSVAGKCQFWLGFALGSIVVAVVVLLPQLRFQIVEKVVPASRDNSLRSQIEPSQQGGACRESKTNVRDLEAQASHDDSGKNTRV